jgi:ATP-dependent Lon protease
MNVYEIEPPDASGARRIASSIYSDIRASHHWGSAFPEAPTAAVLEKLSAIAPREMRRELVGAFGNARLESRDEISPDDLASRNAKRPRMGF